jgi:ABC-2 type transport system permease protein
MSTTAPTRSSRSHAPGSGVTFGGVLRSEWIKLRSLRSTVWCFAIIAVLIIGFGALFSSVASGFEGMQSTPEQDQSLAASVTTIGVAFAQLVAAVLGALIITGEFGTGMIRSTFTAVPRRTPALVAKLILVAIGTFVVSAVSLGITSLLAVPLLRGVDIELDLTDGRYWLSMLGAAASVAFMAMISFGLGMIIRNSTGAIAAAIGLVFVVPILFSIAMGLVAGTWVYSVYEFIPPTAASRLYEYVVDGSSMLTAPPVDGAIRLEAWEALLVLVGWVVVLFGAGLALVKRRDV